MEFDNLSDKHSIDVKFSVDSLSLSQRTISYQDAKLAKCPLSKTIMNEPVLVNDQDYEKSAILEYLKTHNNICPRGLKVDTEAPGFPQNSSRGIRKLCKKARLA